MANFVFIIFVMLSGWFIIYKVVLNKRTFNNNSKDLFPVDLPPGAGEIVEIPPNTPRREE